MNETTSFRRIAVTLTIGSFAVAALMGIIALLSGGSFGEGEGRVLLTTLIIGCASICSLCYLATAGTRWAPIGVAGGAVVLLPLVTALVLVWSDWSGDSEGTLKAFGVGVVLAVTIAQICLLLALAGDGRVGGVLWPTIAIAAIVAVLVSGLILGEVDAEDFWRVLGILAILDVLGTLVTIALAKFGGRGDAEAAGSRRSDRVPVTLSIGHAAGIEDLSRRTGRPPADLVAEAVERYLNA